MEIAFQNSVIEEQNICQHSNYEKAEYTNDCFELVNGLRNLILMLKECKYKLKTCNCITSIFLHLNELEEIGDKYPDDHLISSLICIFIELQGHKPKENGQERDISDEELCQCPLELEMMEKYLKRQCNQCFEFISKVIVHPHQNQENLKSEAFFGINKCANDFEFSQFHKEFCKYWQKKEIFGKAYCLTDDLEVNPNERKKMEQYQQLKFEVSIIYQ